MPASLLNRPHLWIRATVAILVAAGAVALIVGDRLEVAGYGTPGSESDRATEQLQKALGHNPEPGVVVLARTRAAGSAATVDARLRSAVGRLAARVARDPAVGRVVTPYGRNGNPILLSRDRRQALALVHFRSTDADKLAEPIDRVRDEREPGLDLRFGGYGIAEIELNRIFRDDLIKAELIAFPLLALLVFLFFRGLVASAIPMIIGALSMLGAYAGLRLLGQLFDVALFALNLAVLLALGLAVDYGLLLASRFREEAAARGPGKDAVRATLATAGRAVAFSGLAVATACAPLLFFAQGVVYSMGLAGVFVAVLSAAVALAVGVPLLLLWGERIAAKPPPAAGTTRWYRWAKAVMRHPVELALIGVLLLVAAAAPALRADLTFPSRTSVPVGTEVREVSDSIARDFAADLGTPITIVTGTEAVEGLAPRRLARAANRFPGIAFAGPISDRAGRVVGVQAAMKAPPLSATGRGAVEFARGLEPRPLVGGRTAEFIDLEDSVGSHLWPAALLVTVLAFFVLFALTRSILLPVKALVFHALVLAASVGLMVLVFQDDMLGIGSLLGYGGPPELDLLVVVVVIASTFGLAADYSILLLARVVEEHRAGHDDVEAVALAVERTGPVITSAAVLLCVALGALGTSSFYLLDQLTFGQIAGVVIDITLVRLVLVPAFIRVLGPLNWWLPRPLHRFFRTDPGTASKW